MDGSKADDRDKARNAPKAPSAPRSVRDGMVGERTPDGRRLRRKGRRGPESRNRTTPGAAPAAAEASPPEPGARIARATREIEVDGERWLAKVVGSSASPGGLDSSVRLLEISFEAPGEPPLTGTGYVPGVDLDGAGLDALERLLGRLRRHPAGSEGRAAGRPGGRSRRPPSGG